MITCKYCESVLQGELMPGAILRCAVCGKKNKLPQRREFAEIAFESLVLGQSGTELDRDGLAAAIAASRLDGARWNRIKGSLEKAGHANLALEELLDCAKGIVRAKSRAAGRDMFVGGLVFMLMFVIIIGIQFYLRSQTIYISASLLAAGIVMTLVGALKWATGVNIQ